MNLYANFGKIKLGKKYEKFINSMKSHLRKDDKKTKQDLMWITLYWLSTTFVFVYSIRPRPRNIEFTLGEFWLSIVLIFIPFILVVLKDRIAKKRYMDVDRNRLLSILYIPIGSIILFSIVILTGLSCLRIHICAASIIFFIMVYNIIVFSRETGGALKFAHRRYLEYMRISIWGIVFVIYGYFSSLFLYTSYKIERVYQESGIVPRGLSVIWPMSYPNTYPLIDSLIQTGCAFALGIILVIIAFNRKLKQFEMQLKRS